jgi:hypothetical protein
MDVSASLKPVGEMVAFFRAIPFLLESAHARNNMRHLQLPDPRRNQHSARKASPAPDNRGRIGFFPRWFEQAQPEMR